MLHGWTVRGDLADPLIKRSVSGSIVSGSGLFDRRDVLDLDLSEPGIGYPDASVVDPDPVGSESLWTGRIRIRTNLLRSGSGVEIRTRDWI
jgi:hypothetical protein